MKSLICTTICYLLIPNNIYGQTDIKHNPKKLIIMNTDKLTNPVVRKAIEALQSGDKNS